MKIHFIHPIFSIFGGAEKVLLDLYHQTEKDYSVEFYTIYKSDNLNSIKDIHGPFIEKPPLVYIFGYKINPFINKYFRKLGDTLARNYQEGDKVVLSNFPASLILYEALKINPKIKKEDTYWISFEPDRILYYSKTVNFGYMPPDLEKFRYKFITQFLRSWKKKDDLVIKNHVGKIITLSDYVTELTRKVYGLNNVATNLCMYVDLEKMNKINCQDARKKLTEHYHFDLSEKDFVILSLSRLEHSKGLLQLMDVLSKLREKGITFKCLIGGRGTLYPHLQQEAEKFPDLKVLGFIPDEVMKYLYSASDLFVFLGKKETGGPLTVLEAMYSGAIPLAANDAGPTELIENEKTGFLVNPDNIQEIINLVIKIYQTRNKPEFRKMREMAYQSVLENHTLDMFYQKFRLSLGLK